MSAGAVRRKFISSLRGFDAYSVPVAWAVFTGYILQIVLLIAAGAMIMKLSMHWFFVAVLVVAVQTLIATRLRGLNNIVHECSHASFCQNREQNDLIGKLSASLLLGSFSRYKAEHMTHHAHLGNYERDADLKRIEPLGLHDQLTARVIGRHILNPFLGRHLPYYLSVNVDKSDGIAFSAIKVGTLFISFVFAFANPVFGALFLVLPYLFFFTALNYWADCIDHAGLASENDDLDSSRNVLVPSPVRLLLFPRNDCYHLVHHLFPTVPAAHLAEAHQILMDDPEYSARANAAGLEAKELLGQQVAAK